MLRSIRRPRAALLCAATSLAVALPLVGAPLAAAQSSDGALPAETIAARSMFFGAENVDQATGEVDRGEVHLSWVSVATFAAAVDGHVLLLDAYIHKDEDPPNYVPASYQDLIDLRPAAILVGHGHFDHGLEAGTIAAQTGATMVGTQSHCDQAVAQVEAAGLAAADLDCLAVFGNDAVFGDAAQFDLLDGVCTSALLHVHSAAEPPDPDHPVDHTVIPVPDPGQILLHPPGFLLDSEGDEGGTVLYQLRVGDFSLTYHDSSGPLKEQAPEVFDALRALPQTDVQVGAILGFNQITNGLRDPAMYIEAIRPTVFVPNHHDFVTEYGSADEFEPVLLAELEYYGAADTDVRFLYDPYDYVRPNLLSYEIDDARWAGATEDRCLASAGGPGGPAPGQGAVDGQGKGALPVTGGGLAIAGVLVSLAWLGRRR